MKKSGLINIAWPEFGAGVKPVETGLEELEIRLLETRKKMEERKLTHLVVYGDREHFANLLYLINFDPRFEEALLIIDLKNDPLVLAGNECIAHLTASPLFNAGKLRHELYQPFSLLNQPKGESRFLNEIFLSEGMNSRSRIGCAGWKYFSVEEHPDPEHALDIPGYITDSLRKISTFENVVNCNDLFMHPGYGLRAKCTAPEIALFEFSNVMASEGMKNLIFNIREGMTDFELVRHYNYSGYPLNCHIGMKCGGNKSIGLSSPGGHVIRKGDPFSTNIGYWGSNICRAGWLAENERDLPSQAKGYIDQFAGRYFSAMAEWYKSLRIGVKGGVPARIIDDLLPFGEFGIYLNPGHLIHYDEWLSSPIFKDSEIEIQSGMYFQVDVIPKSGKFYSTRMEDGIIIADSALQNELKTGYPEVYGRCMKRRDFMINTLGLELPYEILPLSNIPGIVPPFFLNPAVIFSL